MNDLDRFTRLQRRVDRLRAEKARSDGVLEQLYQQLAEKYGCKTLKQAKVKFLELKRELGQKRKERDQAIEELEEKYPDCKEGP